MPQFNGTIYLSVCIIVLFPPVFLEHAHFFSYLSLIHSFKEFIVSVTYLIPVKQHFLSKRLRSILTSFHSFSSYTHTYTHISSQRYINKPVTSHDALSQFNHIVLIIDMQKKIVDLNKKVNKMCIIGVTCHNH